LWHQQRSWPSHLVHRNRLLLLLLLLLLLVQYQHRRS
jgi:hypothetical protein